MSTQLVLDWDLAKAAANFAKHGVRFEDAIAVCQDPLALSVPDRAAIEEERWITMGQAGVAGLILVVHTHSHHFSAQTNQK